MTTDQWEAVKRILAGILMCNVGIFLCFLNFILGSLVVLGGVILAMYYILGRDQKPDEK